MNDALDATIRQCGDATPTLGVEGRHGNGGEARESVLRGDRVERAAEDFGREQAALHRIGRKRVE